MPLDARHSHDTVELLVPGLTCAACMRKVEARLSTVAGVSSARVNLTNRRVAIRFDQVRTEPEALIDELDRLGYPARPLSQTDTDDPMVRESRALLLRVGVSGFAAMNVMLLSIGVWSGADAAMRDLLHWVSALIALPAMAYAGTPFFTSAWNALRAGSLNMDVPISLAILLSAGNSVLETAMSGQHAYFDAGIMLIFFLLVGRYIEQLTRARARSSASELLAMTGRTTARVLPDGTREKIATADLEPGMQVAIAPGERIPADGRILVGASDLDRSLITGESLPVRAQHGTEVNAGTLNLSSEIIVEVTRAGDDSLLAEIAGLVGAAERGRSRHDQLAERAAKLYAPSVHILAALAFAGWLWATGDGRLSTQIAVAVLIITCPCALALAVPTVHTVATSRLFRGGIFLKDGGALERLCEVDTVVFDKTGTLTDGRPRLIDPLPDAHPAWPLIAALSRASRHPYATALNEAARARKIVPAEIEDMSEVPGQGVEARVNGVRVRLGRPGWVGTASAQVALSLPDSDVVHAFSFAQSLRPDAEAVCERLRRQGYDLYMLSGDHPDAVAEIATATGIADARSGLTPQDKHAVLKVLRDDRRKVLMVGDGLNDSPALAAAHVSMSPGSAADTTQSVSDIVFTGESLQPVLTALDVAATATRRARESIGIATLYNVIAVPVAVAGLVTPLVAALAMSGSSIVVTLNALRQRTPS
ncbi:MAG: heavy metal translocating P-type ATPase [Pseudomonadota bacterium]